DKIKKGWSSQHWRAPHLETMIEPDRVRLTMPTVSLIPEDTLTFLRDYVGEAKWTDLSKAELQTLATAHAEAGVSNARMQEVLDDHPTEISRMLNGLCEKGLLVSEPRRRWTRYHLVATPHPSSGSSLPKPGSSLPKPGNSLLKASDFSDDAESGTSRRGQVAGLGGDEAAIMERQPEIWARLLETARPVRDTQRANPAMVRATIQRLCTDHYLGLSTLADLLDRKPHRLRHSYLTPMVKEGLLLRRYPTDPNHPQQAYRTAS
ncbi:MAG: hypothetical protein LBS59_03885, partial [Puniceicoccales bacterium]|nr:hypothetical protein [Puniceicoccales bacterium]